MVEPRHRGSGSESPPHLSKKKARQEVDLVRSNQFTAIQHGNTLACSTQEVKVKSSSNRKAREGFRKSCTCSMWK